MNCSFDFMQHAVRERQTYTDYHCHPNFELVYYISGEGTTALGKETYRYFPGAFTISKPGVMHNEYRDSETEILFACFYCDHDSVDLDNGLYEDKDGTLLRIVTAMMEELRGRKRLFDLAIHGLLCQMIAEASRLGGRTTRQEASEKVRYAKNYLEQYCSEKIDLQALAGNLGYSYEHFRHFFKQSTGYPPSQFVIRNRIKKAKSLLAETGRSITDIGIECGFSNTAQFCMMFRKDTGLAPKAFRESYARSETRITDSYNNKAE